MSKGPLENTKVIEIKGLGPGPYAGQLLADLGAEVIVVERASATNSVAIPSQFDVCSRGKKSIAVNLKSDEGLEILFKLIAESDVLIEGFRPGVAERLGFGPEQCLQTNPRLVYGRMTGWGQSGPLASSAGHDMNYISITGLAEAIGPKGKPAPPLNIVGDLAGGSLFLVMGILASLFERSISGKGQVVDAAITDGSAHLFSMFYSMANLGKWTATRESNLLDGGAPYYTSYSTSDNRFVSVCCIEPQFFKEMVLIANFPDWLIEAQNDPQRWPEIKDFLTEEFAKRTRDEWIQLFEGTDACISGILDYSEAITHPHNVARKTYIDIDGIKQPAPAPRFSRSYCSVPEAPCAEGADTNLILEGLGYSDSEIKELASHGVLT